MNPQNWWNRNKLSMNFEWIFMFFWKHGWICLSETCWYRCLYIFRKLWKKQHHSLELKNKGSDASWLNWGFIKRKRVKRLAMSSDGKKVPKFDQGMLPFFFRLKGDPIQTVFCIQYVYIYIISSCFSCNENSNWLQPRTNILASALIPGGGQHLVAVPIHLVVFRGLQEVQGGGWKRWCKNPPFSTCPWPLALLWPGVTIPPYP